MLSILCTKNQKLNNCSNNNNNIDYDKNNKNNDNNDKIDEDDNDDGGGDNDGVNVAECSAHTVPLQRFLVTAKRAGRVFFTVADDKSVCTLLCVNFSSVASIFQVWRLELCKAVVLFDIKNIL